MEILMTDTTCICETCGCRDACDFYAESIKPVIEVTENTCCMGVDPVADAYVKKLIEVLDGFSCEYYEGEDK